VPSYNNDPNPSHGYAADAEAYAKMAWNHPSHWARAETESWSAAGVLQAAIDGAYYAEAIRQQGNTRIRNGVITRRLRFFGLLVLVAILCAIGTDAAVRAGVGDLNHATVIVRLVPAHVACVVHAARKC
jgi:hypothetical protein